MLKAESLGVKMYLAKQRGCLIFFCFILSVYRVNAMWAPQKSNGAKQTLQMEVGWSY